MLKRILLLLFLAVGNIAFSNAQLCLEHKTDSTVFYDDIYKFSQQNKLFKSGYNLIFKQIDTSAIQQQETKSRQTSFEGKIIRRISVAHKRQIDIVPDSSAKVEEVNEVGGFLHTKTRAFVVRNLLLFKENDRYDSLHIEESERLIRSQRFIAQGAIHTLPVAGSADSVDIEVYIRDEFKLVPVVELSSSQFNVGLKNINLFGWGHQFYGIGGVDNSYFEYDIPNIAHTYINANVSLRNNWADTTGTKRISLQRPFSSIFTRWAGGVMFSHTSEKNNGFLPDVNETTLQRMSFYEQDYWAAYALKANGNTLKSQTRSLILSARYWGINFTKKLSPEYDPLQMYSDESYYLLGIGFLERRYKKDRYLLKFGFIEDVPVGWAYSIAGGIRDRGNLRHFYLATKMSFSRYIGQNYWGALIEYGSFFDDINIREGVLKSEINYFSPLIETNGWKIRQFVRPQLVLGIKSLPNDIVTLDDNFGINGFNSYILYGKHKIVCHFQTQIYSPVDIWGFKIGGYLQYSAGMIGDNEYGFSRSEAYSSVGLGLMFRNDHLVFNTFELSVSLFPYIPGVGHNVFKFNMYESQSFGFRNFDINKPEIITYR